MASLPTDETLSFVALAPDERVLAFTLNEVHESPVPASSSVDTERTGEPLSVESSSAPTSEVVTACTCDDAAMDKVARTARGTSNISTCDTVGVISNGANTQGRMPQIESMSNTGTLLPGVVQTSPDDTSERAREATIENGGQSDTSSSTQNASHPPVTLLPVFAYLEHVDQLYFDQVCNAILLAAFSYC